MSARDNSKVSNENEHLLEYNWTLWFRPPTNHQNSGPQAKAWEKSQKIHFTAHSVEEFWREFHGLPRIVAGHPPNCDYSLFKEGVKPMWEDEFNEMGGRWTYSVERRPNTNGPSNSPTSVIEQVWLDVMLLLIGEGFEPYGDRIAGGVCGIRNGRGKQSNELVAKIHIWTKDASDVEANTKIGQILKSTLNIPDGQLIYAPHDSPKGRSNHNNQNFNLRL